MSWYHSYKLASGKFRLPRIMESLISYFEGQVRRSFGDPIQIQENVSAGDLIGDYKPKKDSIFFKDYHDKNHQVMIIVRTSYQRGDYPNLGALFSFGLNTSVFLINLDVTVSPGVKGFDDIPVSLRTKIEHEINHGVEKVLGYDVKNVDYKSNIDTKKDFYQYVAQPGERQQKYTNVENSLRSGAQNRDKSSYEGLKTIYDMFVSIKTNYPKNMREFVTRIFGILNKLDGEFGRDVFWMKLREKVISILKDQLEII